MSTPCRDCSKLTSYISKSFVLPLLTIPHTFSIVNTSLSLKCTLVTAEKCNWWTNTVRIYFLIYFYIDIGPLFLQFLQLDPNDVDKKHPRPVSVFTVYLRSWALSSYFERRSKVFLSDWNKLNFDSSLHITLLQKCELFYAYPLQTVTAFINFFWDIRFFLPNAPTKSRLLWILLTYILTNFRLYVTGPTNNSVFYWSGFSGWLFEIFKRKLNVSHYLGNNFSLFFCFLITNLKTLRILHWQQWWWYT